MTSLLFVPDNRLITRVAGGNRNFAIPARREVRAGTHTITFMDPVGGTARVFHDRRGM